MSALAERVRRPVRVAGTIRAAARAHDAGILAVARRALVLTRSGWALEEADKAGLLDPRLDGAHLARHTSTAEAFGLQDRLNPLPMIILAHDKVLFGEWLSARGIPTPTTIAVFERRGPGWAAGGRPVGARPDWVRLIAGLDREFVLKPSRGHLGYEVRIMRPAGGSFRDGEGVHRTPDEVVRLMETSRFDGFVLQERLLPHPAIAALGGSDALQTIRISTLVRDDGAILLLAPTLKVASGAADIDNFRFGALGNVLVSIRTADGVLESGRAPAPGGRGLVEITHHPLTGRALGGEPAPGWDVACATALAAARAALPLHTIGWDVAITPDGPVVIEANPQWDPAWDHPEWPEAIAALRTAAARPRDGSPGRRSRSSIP